MERVRRARAMCRGIGQWIDDLQLLDDRAGPSVRDDERHRILMLRANVNEMDVQPIDLGDELRQGVQSRLALAPVVFRPPIARELLNRRELHALRCIRDRLPFRPLRRVDAPAQFGELRFRNIHTKGTNCGLVTARCCATSVIALDLSAKPRRPSGPAATVAAAAPPLSRSCWFEEVRECESSTTGRFCSMLSQVLYQRKSRRRQQDPATNTARFDSPHVLSTP